jgi:hypothetical protein
MMFYYGCVENRNDPLKLGRCQVRIVGLHTEDKTMLPTDELPWAYPMMPINSASISGLGWSPTGVVQGSWVLCIFLDPDNQQPIMLGTIGGIPHTRITSFMNDSLNSVITVDETGDLVSANGDNVTSIIDEIVQQSETTSRTTQYEGTNFKVDAVTTVSGTSFNVMDKATQTAMATSKFDASLNKYTVELINPENYKQELYLPFTGVAPMTFMTLEEMTKYFDSKF